MNLAPRKYQDGLSKNSLLSRDSLQVRDHRPTGAPAASTAAQGGENEGAEGGWAVFALIAGPPLLIRAYMPPATNQKNDAPNTIQLSRLFSEKD